VTVTLPNTAVHAAHVKSVPKLPMSGTNRTLSNSFVASSTMVDVVKNSLMAVKCRVQLISY